jgi:DNA topoisomerase-6 subunit A
MDDITEYKIPRDAISPATPTDLKRASILKKKEWCQSKFWQRQLGLFLERKQKIEIEAFSEHGFDYLAETYLPQKLKEGGVD